MAKTPSKKTYKAGLADAAEMIRAKANVFRLEAPTIGSGRLEKADLLEELAYAILDAAKTKAPFLAEMKKQADEITSGQVADPEEPEIEVSAVGDKSSRD